MKIKLSCELAALVVSLSLPAQAVDIDPTINTRAIRPGERGELLSAHDSGILNLGDTWYWFGEHRPGDVAPGRKFISCYSSADLVNWKFHGLPTGMTALEGCALVHHDGRHLWMPLEIRDGRLWLPEPREWMLDVTRRAAASHPGTRTV